MAEGTQPDDSSDEEMTEPSFALDTPERSTRTLRRRAAPLAATALLLVAAVVGLFVHSTSDPGGAFNTLLQIYTPTPQPTFIPGANVIFIMRGVPWGVLTIDGKAVPQIVAAVRGVSLTYGTHRLAYQARYFPTLRCTISAPRQPEDSCPIDGPTGESQQFLSGYGLARMVNLDLDSSKLQADQFSALEQQINRMLSAKTYTTTIAPGDRYMNAQGVIATASEPLTLTLQLNLDPLVPNSSDSAAGGPCPQVCVASTTIGDGESVDGYWPLDVQVGERWSLTDAHGNTTVLGYPAIGPGLAQDTLSVGVQLTASTWSISGLEHPDTSVLFDHVGHTIDESFTSQTLPQPTLSFGGYGLVFAANPIAGCIINLTVYDDPATNLPTHLRVLWRFGALMALDDATHKHYPSLPIATAAEQAAANRILQEAQGAG